MRIAYTLKNGIAENIRGVKPDYVLQAGEFETVSDDLPALDTLSDEPALQALADARALAQKRDRAAQALLRQQEDEMLASAIADPNAPQAVKDYALELAKGKK